MAFKEKALRRMAEKFNKAGIPWALGAGYVMCSAGIADTFHDFDVFVPFEQAAAADKALSRLGMKSEERSEDGLYRAAYHFDGADIDLSAGIRVNGVAYAFDAGFNAHAEEYQGTTIYLMPAEDWMVLYDLYGRTAKADAVETYLKLRGNVNADRFAAAFTGEMPEETKARIARVCGQV